MNLQKIFWKLYLFLEKIIEPFFEEMMKSINFFLKKVLNY